MPDCTKIEGWLIKEWVIFTKNYTYFSPNTFMIQSPYYHDMSENMKVRVIQGNLMLKFQQVFSTFWNDPEFKHVADNTLITMIIASLQFENPKVDRIIPYGVVCNEIMLIQEGHIDMYYMK
jgi:hypothetical protein